MRHEFPTGERVTAEPPSPVAAIELTGVGLSFRSARLKREIVALDDINLSVPDRLFVSPVSYTHLTLPTIYSV